MRLDMLKKIPLTMTLGLSLSVGAAESAETQVEEIRKTLAAQQVRLDAMQRQIREQEATSKEAVAQYVRTEVAAAMKNREPLLVPGSPVSSWKFSGDLRLRYLREEFRDDQAFTQGSLTGNVISRDRFRQRLRLGMNWESKDELWETGARLATGAANGRSTDDTYGDEDGGAYEHGDLRLDLAYAKMKFHSRDDDYTSFLTFGQQLNPFKTARVFMDTDLNPVGISYQYERLLSGRPEMKTEERDAWFNSLGIYTVDHRNNGWESGDVLCLQAQTGYRCDRFAAAAGFSHYSSNVRDQDANGSDNPGDIEDGGYGFDIVQLYGEIYLLGDGSRAGRQRSLMMLVDLAANLSAVDGDSQIRRSTDATLPEPAGQGEPLAAYLGAEGRFDAWSGGLAGARVEQDALPKFNLDFANGQTGYQGISLKLGYDFTQNFNLVGFICFNQTIEENASQRDHYNFNQIDIVWKF